MNSASFNAGNTNSSKSLFPISPTLFFTNQKLSKVFLKGTRPLHCLFIRFYPTRQYTICQFKIYPLVITHEMIFKISRFKIIYFFMHFNSVLVYTIVMKRYVTYPDWVEKFRSPGHTIKKTKQGYGLYSCTSKYVPGGKPKSIQTYLGKITPDGFIPKSVVSKHPVYVEFGLSHFIISSFKRDLIRSSFRATDDTVYLGVVQYIFGSCQDIFLSSCFLTYKNKESLCKYRDSISATRIKTISNKIARLMESYFDAQEIAVLSQILKLAVVDVTSDHIYYPTIPEEVVDIIERNGLHYE